MSCRTIVYKGMLNASQLLTFYPDLLDERFESPLGLVHSRFSTNTFPSWSRAHPYRYISHNGEINTLRGNVNWMFARQSTFRSTVFGEDLNKILPAVDVDGSDTTIFDNVLELLHLSGRSLAHTMMMMVPEPWSRDPSMSPERRAFYEYHSCLMEPWDGPASLAFTDGVRIGATLDRNGLRPGRYSVTRDGRVVMASEAGVLDIPPEDVIAKGRLQPGRMFLVDTEQGRIIPDDELKAAITGEHPYEQWVRESLVNLADLPAPDTVILPDHETVLRRQEVFGYTTEDVRLIVNAMATTGADPIGSMGNDAPLAVLSERPQLLYNYFKQLFAQVTNPPVDAIREEIIMATDRSIGPEANLLEPGPDAAHQVALPSPVISNAELETIRALDGGPDSHGFRTITLPILFKVADNGAGLRRAIEDLRRQASEAIAEGYNQVILSDRGHTETDAPIPALLAVSAVHHHLVRAGTRGRVGLLLESGEPREAHHFCLLIGYGASAINPYLAFETIDDQVRLGVIPRSHGGRGEALPQGRDQGRDQGDQPDGHLHGPQLPRRPGLRGDRAQPRLRRRVLHLDADPDRRHRHRDREQGGQGPPGPRLAARAARSSTSSSRPAASTSSAPTARTTCSTRSPSTRSRRRSAPATTRPSRTTARWSTTRAPASRPCAGSWSCGRPSVPCPSTRSSRSRPSCAGSRPGRCPTARSPARPTRRWRSR